MFETLFSSLRKQGSNENAETRRKFLRRSCDKCVGVINDQTYPVEDWSLGGLLIRGDARAFSLENEVDVTIKFKLRNDMLDIAHKGRIVRKTQDKIALEFLPLPRQTRNSFQNVVDDYVAGHFAESHMV